jgi:hypothetical protein
MHLVARCVVVLEKPCDGKSVRDDDLISNCAAGRLEVRVTGAGARPLQIEVTYPDGHTGVKVVSEGSRVGDLMSNILPEVRLHAGETFSLRAHGRRLPPTELFKMSGQARVVVEPPAVQLSFKPTRGAERTIKLRLDKSVGDAVALTGVRDARLGLVVGVHQQIRWRDPRSPLADHYATDAVFVLGIAPGGCRRAAALVAGCNWVGAQGDVGVLAGLLCARNSSTPLTQILIGGNPAVLKGGSAICWLNTAGFCGNGRYEDVQRRFVDGRLPPDVHCVQSNPTLVREYLRTVDVDPFGNLFVYFSDHGSGAGMVFMDEGGRPRAASEMTYLGCDRCVRQRPA